jgi:hypothetical protein
MIFEHQSADARGARRPKVSHIGIAGIDVIVQIHGPPHESGAVRRLLARLSEAGDPERSRQQPETYQHRGECDSELLTIARDAHWW